MPPVKPPANAWRFYLIIVIKYMLALYVATFCIAFFYQHRGVDWLFSGILLTILYLVIFVICVKEIIRGLPLPLLMIAAPTLPLLFLLLALSLLPLLQWLH